MPPEVVQDDVEYARPEGCPLLARIYRPRASPAGPRPLLKVELEVFPGVGHSFANFPGEAADRCIARMRSFIRRRLR